MHKEGRVLVGAAALDLLIFAILSVYFDHWVLYVLAFLSAAVFFFLLHFFRHPVRVLPEKNDRLIYAPADGKVVAIEEIPEHESFEEAAVQLSIFMSPLNVHVNRIPQGGRVYHSQYKKGRYLVAFHPKSSQLNEQAETVIDGSNGRLVLRQIAGAVARRISTYVEKGDQVQQGDELGFIKFGSRVDVLLPRDQVEIMVKMGEKVKGNITVLAKWREREF